MTEKYKALIVDDNDVNATISAEMINSFELEGSIAVSGTEAIRMIRENNYAFVLMDYIMPEMNGIEATRRIREFSDVPVYAMIEDREGEVAAEFRSAGADSVISKSKTLKGISCFSAIADSSLESCSLRHCTGERLTLMNSIP